MLSFINTMMTVETSKLNTILGKLSATNIIKVIEYAKMVLKIQESVEKKERHAYNHRYNREITNEGKAWEYMTKDVIESHKKTMQESILNPSNDVIFRSRFSGVEIADSYKYLNIFGSKNHKVIMADYVMFNPHFLLDYHMVDRLLPYCKIKFIDDYTYKVDGWIFQSLFYVSYGKPQYKITYDMSDYDDMELVKTEEEKRQVVRLLIQVMNETPEEYVNLNNYNVIKEWYDKNDNYINSYNTNLYKLGEYKKNKELENNVMSEDELIIMLDDKVTTDELKTVLLDYVKGGVLDTLEIGLKISTETMEYQVEINTKQVDLKNFYEMNGYVRTRKVIDSLNRTIKHRINCDNLPEKITKGELLAALYNCCNPCGMGILQSDDNTLTVEEATKILERTNYIDYLKGVGMKIHFEKFPIMEFERFDKYNGQGKFMDCINKLQLKQEIKKEKMGIDHVINELSRMTKGNLNK